MSLALFENFLVSAESILKVRNQFPAGVNAAELESVITGHSIVLLHSYMEQCMKEAVAQMAARCADLRVRNYVLKLSEASTGRVGVPSLKETLGKFDASCKKVFGKKLAADLDEHGRGWGSIVTQRIQIGHHGKPATCSFEDVKGFYADVKKVLSLFCDSLGLTPQEKANVSPLIT